MDLPPRARSALLTRLKVIAAEPSAEHPRVTAMKGEKSLFRLRQGDWRAVFRIDHDAGRMTVLLIGTRGEVYR
jgi:mRNA interferase RelE/StbE